MCLLNNLSSTIFFSHTRRFLSSPDHKRNVIDLPKTQSTAASTKRKVSLKSSETISDALPSPPKWRGVPFGVVLQLDGLDVADACFRVKRYYTALYYCEMAMNNVSRCGNYFETIAGESHHDLNNTYIADISGFGLERKQNTRTVLESALVALNISQRCLAQLQQLDALQGVGAQGSDMMLKQNINSFDTLQGSHRDKTLPMLLDIDVGLQEDVAAGTVSNEATSFRDISTCLEELGLNHTKRHYLAGIASMLGSDERQDENNHYLREKWFEDSLNRTFQWDDSLLPKRSEGETAPEATQFINQQFRDDRPVGTHCQPQHDRFYEPIHDALRSFVGEDVSSGLSHILEARRSVLADIEVLHGSESKLKSTTTHISKLNILGNLELVARAMEHSVPLQFVLNRWEFGEAGENDLKKLLLSGDESFDIKEQSTAIDGSLFRLIQTDLSVKEVLLKVLMKKFAQQEDISESIASHIYTTCQVYRDLGRPDAATSSLSRLRSLVQTFQQSETHSFPSDLPLMLRLEDAKTLSRKHDFDSAIAHSKMIVSHLNMLESTSDADQIQFHAEALLLGGLWMSHQNVDATVTIETFFQKAATLSFQVHSENSSSERTTLQASVAFFKLGEFASSLYASASAKVSSEAWKRRCLVASERKKELETLRPGVVKLQKKYNRNQTDQNRSVYEEAALPFMTLEREINIDDRGTESVYESLQKYLLMAVESYLGALKICPPSSTDISKHVFKLIGLWFKNCQKSETKNAVNELFKANLPQIPSYHFVPLIYQIFSRIDEIESSDGTCFQSTLWEFVFKICSDHPYHGIVQLIALSNGKRVGTGVGGRGAKDYLDNVGNGKVEAANALIQELHKHAPKYVAGLIDSVSCTQCTLHICSSHFVSNACRSFIILHSTVASWIVI